MNQARTVTGCYQLQYLLTLQTNTVNVATSHLTPSPSATGGWYDNNAGVQITADQDVANGTGSRYDFRNFSGDVSPNPTTANPVSVTMNQARTVTGNYQLQYLLTLQTNTVNVAASHLTPRPSATGVLFGLDVA